MRGIRIVGYMVVLAALAAGCRKSEPAGGEASPQQVKQQQVPQQQVSEQEEVAAADAEPRVAVAEQAAVVEGSSVETASAEAEQPEKDYFAVFMEGKKVGHAIQSRIVADGRVRSSSEVSITISRAGVPITVAMSETSIETADGKPLGFETMQDMAIMKIQGKGVIEPNGTVNLTVTSMGNEQKSTMEWPQGAMMAEGLILLTREKGLKEGLEYSAKVFSPEAMQAFDAKIRIGSRQNVDLLGRVVPLTEVTTTLDIPGAGEIISTGYVDDELNTQKDITSIAGITVEMVACAKEFALGENDVFEVIDKMFMASPEPLTDLGKASSITYTLKPKDGAELKIPSDDNQQVEQLGDGRMLLTVRPVTAPSGVKFPYDGDDETAVEAMKPTRFVQSDRKEIIELAGRAVGDTKDAAEAVRKIEAFVADYVENRSLSVGYASAAEVAESRQGDCSEFAVLSTALCRAAGIPAQVVTGVAYVDDFRGFQGFGGHAWARAYVGGKWVCLDAAFKGAGLGGYDAGHIALAVGNGDPEGFFDLVTSLGRFEIEKVVVEGRP